MRPTIEQLQKINSFVLEGEFTQNDVEVFLSLLVDNEPTAYYSILKDDIKSAFLTDLKEGKTALNILHASMEMLPVGKSFDGFSSAGTLYGWFYIPTNRTVASTSGGSIETNDVIAQIKSGVYRATSVEFFTSMDDYTCSICGNPYYSMDCDHYAGKVYQVKNAAGVEEDTTCIVYVGNSKGDATLSANSLVVDGAVSNAGFVPIEINEQVASSFGMVSAKEVGGKKVMFAFKPNVCNIMNKTGIQEIEPKGGTEMEGIPLEKYTAIVEEASTLKSQLGTAQASIEELKTKLADAEAKRDEYKSAMDATLEQSKTDSVKADKFDALNTSVIDLVNEYGVKARGEEFNAEEFLSDETELKEKFSALLGEFMEKFPAGAKAPGSSNEEYTVPIPVDKFKFNTKIGG